MIQWAPYWFLSGYHQIKAGAVAQSPCLCIGWGTQRQVLSHRQGKTTSLSSWVRLFHSIPAFPGIQIALLRYKNPYPHNYEIMLSRKCWHALQMIHKSSNWICQAAIPRMTTNELISLRLLCWRLALRPQLQGDGRRAHFYSSPFSRTRQTTEECIKACQLPAASVQVLDVTAMLSCSLSSTLAAIIEYWSQSVITESLNQRSPMVLIDSKAHSSIDYQANDLGKFKQKLKFLTDAIRALS